MRKFTDPEERNETMLRFVSVIACLFVAVYSLMNWAKGEGFGFIPPDYSWIFILVAIAWVGSGIVIAIKGTG